MSVQRKLIGLAAAALVLAGAVLTWRAQGASDIERQAAAMTGGEPARGKEAIGRYGCATCHTIPGVDGARGQVGPSLEGIASRSYLAGKLTNTPPNLIQWIREPQEVQPGTAMPELGVTDHDGKDIAAYLYTLRK
jgi:cytochrome c2